MKVVAPRLAVLLARDQPVGAVLRRGPSRWACLLRWDVDRDVFEEGDWFKGRIYERRSDLSPDGRYLVHLAGGFEARQPAGIETTYARTAVSELPGLRPVIWWEKNHTWHGGGLFRTDDELWVNDPARAPARNGLKTLRLLFNDDARGEDEPVYAERLSRDGWQVSEPLLTDDSGRRYEVRRRVGAAGAVIVMRRSLEGFRKVIGYSLEASGGASHPFEAEWADFDHRNRLVAARQGQIVELRLTDDLLHPTLLADLNDLVPPDQEPERKSSMSCLGPERPDAVADPAVGDIPLGRERPPPVRVDGVVLKPFDCCPDVVNELLRQAHGVFAYVVR